jgi:SAM-dependent methyltransferase
MPCTQNFISGMANSMRKKNLFSFLCPDAGKHNEHNREVWLQTALQTISTGSRILDAGAGTQQYRKFCAHLKYVSQDFAQYDGAGNSTGLQIKNFDYGKLDIVSDITAIPEPDSSFDAIMCIEVLEHLPNPIQVIQEFARLLRPGGHLILTAPCCSLTHFAPYHFTTGFNRYWYETHLADKKFIIVELTPNGNFFEFIAQEVARISSISKRYSNKKPRIYERLALFFVKHMLQRFSKKDNGSAELLCFGYHVVARRLGQSQK